MMAVRSASRRLATHPIPPPPPLPTHSPRCSIISLVAIAIIFGGGAIALGTCWFKGVTQVAAMGRNGAISTIAGGGTLIVALSLIAIYKGCEEETQEEISNLPLPLPQPPVQTMSQMLIQMFHSNYHTDSSSSFVREGVEIDSYDTLRQKYLTQEDPLFQQSIAPLIPNLPHLCYLCYSTPKKDRHFLFGNTILQSGQTVDWAITTQSQEDIELIKLALSYKGFVVCDPTRLLNARQSNRT